MDWQAMFNLAIGAFGLVLGALCSVLWQMIRQLQMDQAAVRNAMAENYVRRDDYRDDMKEVKEMLTQIRDKLDSKADK